MQLLLNRLLPAALINATLTVLCANFIWFPLAIFVLARAVFEPAHPSSWYFEFLTILSLVVAPLLYRVIWQVLEFERSPGEQWLMLNWPVDRQVRFRVVLSEIATGLVATLIAVAACRPCQSVAESFGTNTSEGLILTAGWTMLLLLYSCTLAFVLLLRYRKQSMLLTDSESQCLSDHLKNTARLRKTIAIFSLPIFCGIAGFIQTPGCYLMLLCQSATWLLLMIVVIWWAAGAVIVRYWDSPRAYLFYLFFFVYPGVCCLNLLPAISIILKVGKLSEIY